MRDDEGKWRSAPSRDVFMIDVTGIDLVAFTKHCYDLSAPQGLGLLHSQDGPLGESDAQRMVQACEGHPSLALSLDYVYGRSIKMQVHRSESIGEVVIRGGDASVMGWVEKGTFEGRLLIRDFWLDHTPGQFSELLGRAGAGSRVFPEAREISDTG